MGGHLKEATYFLKQLALRRHRWWHSFRLVIVVQVARSLTYILGERLFTLIDDVIANLAHMHAQPFRGGAFFGLVGGAVGVDAACVE